MKASTLKFAALAGATFLMAAAIPVISRTSEPAIPTSPDAEVLVSESQDLQEVGGGLTIGPSCLPSTSLSCDNMPIPQGGSCSCEAVLQPKRCRSCDPQYKGQVLQTTCTVRPAPCPPGQTCDIQQLFTRTGFSCAQVH